MFKKIYNKFFFIIKIFFNKNFFFKFAKSQNKNQENNFLKKISKNIKNKNFIEIGFHNTEFNCIGLIEKNFSGILIDSGRYSNIILMKLILNIIGKKRVKVKHLHIEKKNLKKIFHSNLNVGCLSIDIDGNDFWIVKKILEIKVRPEVFIVEYNASFLDFPYTVPYDKNYERYKKHKSGLYHGASLKAFEKLFKKYNYKLIRVIGGVNAVFSSPTVIKKNNLKILNANSEYAEGKIRNTIYKQNAKKQFQVIKHLKLIKI